MANDDNCLFFRESRENGLAESTDDVWDDSLLIKAYDRAVNLAKGEVAKRLSLETDSLHLRTNKAQTQLSRVNSTSSTKWTIGSPCRAIYSVDGLSYEAIISQIFKDSTCIVKFVGYGNTEKVNLSSLQESEGLESQIAQQKDALASKSTTSDDKDNNVEFERMEYESETPKQASNTHPSLNIPFNAAFNMMPPAPPLPPQLIARLPESDDDALSSMLMSWYISGFHTGYYHGIKQAESKKNSRRKI